jgi:hypothetical protein
MAIKLTWVLSLFTNASSPSLETLEGKFTAGASGFPSSSDTNWTTMLGEGLGLQAQAPGHHGTLWHALGVEARLPFEVVCSQQERGSFCRCVSYQAYIKPDVSCLTTFGLIAKLRLKTLRKLTP